MLERLLLWAGQWVNWGIMDPSCTMDPLVHYHRISLLLLYPLLSESIHWSAFFSNGSVFSTLYGYFIQFLQKNIWSKKLPSGNLYIYFLYYICVFSLSTSDRLFISGWLVPEDDQNIVIETSSCNLQFFSELIPTQLRDFHMVSPQVVPLQTSHH